MALLDVKKQARIYRAWAVAEFRLKALAYFDRIRKDERLWK